MSRSSVNPVGLSLREKSTVDHEGAESQKTEASITRELNGAQRGRGIVAGLTGCIQCRLQLLFFWQGNLK